MENYYFKKKNKILRVYIKRVNEIQLRIIPKERG